MKIQGIIWIAIALETILFAGILPILPDIGATTGLGVEYLGVLVGAYAFSSLFTCLPFGLLSDRRNPRRHPRTAETRVTEKAPAKAGAFRRYGSGDGYLIEFTCRVRRDFLFAALFRWMMPFAAS